jgi:hypothetical protein
MSGITNFICRPTGAEVVALCESVSDKNFVTDAEKTQIGIDAIQTAAQVKAAVESFTAGDRITLDNFQDGTANKVLTDTERGQLAALVAATPQFELLEHTFDLAVSAVWADAMPIGSVLIALKYINLTAIGETGAATYKIDLTGGVTADLESGIALTQNTKNTIGVAETAIPGATAVNLTPNAGSLDTGEVKVGLLIRKALVNYPDVV